MRIKKIELRVLSFLFVCMMFFTNIMNIDAKTIIINEASEWETTVNDTTADEIKLGKNIDLTSAIKERILPSLDVDSNATTRTLDLNGNELQVSTDALNIYFKVSGATVIIKDSSESKTGKIVHNTTDSALINIAYNSNISNGSLIINGGTYICHNDISSEFGAIFNQDESTKIIVNDGTFDSRSLLSGTRAALDIKGMVLFNSAATSNTTAASVIKEDTGRITFGNIVDYNHSAYIRLSTGVESKIDTMLLATYTVTSLDSNATYTDSIVVKENEGLQASDVYFNTIYGYDDLKQKIIIKNKGLTPLTIKNITLDNYDSFTIEGPNQAIIEPDATNTSWTIKVNESLSAGSHSAILTIKDENDKSYVSHIRVDVAKKKLTNLGIGFTEKLYYGENHNIEPIINGADELSSGDYEIEYAPVGSENWVKIRPTLVGKYNIRITITNTNYEQNSASSEFEILPTEKVVRIVANSSSQVYNGKQYSDNGFKVYFDNKETENGTLYYNDTVSNILVVGNVKDVKDNKDNNNVIDKNSITITNKECYRNIEIIDGTISIEPVPEILYIYADTVRQKYNGKTLTGKSFSYNTGVLLEGEKIVVAIEGKQLYVGTSENVIVDVQIIRDNENIASNYKINKIDGKLTVTSASQEVNINPNITVKVGSKLSVDKIKEYLGANTESYKIRMKNSTNSTFNELNGFEAGSNAEVVTMEAIAPAIDVNKDGLFEYEENTSEFNITVEEKDIVKLSGLTYIDKYYDKTPIEPTGTLIIENNLVSVDDIEVVYKGTGNTEYESSEAPTNAGTYVVTYKVASNNPTYAGSVSYTFTIKKIQVEIPSEDNNQYVYSKEKQNISINYDNNLVDLNGTTFETNAGDYSYTLTLKDKNNYEWKDGTTDDIKRSWKIEKATPEYTIPTGLTGIKGQTLLEIPLNGRFIWNNPNEKILAGTHTYKATYTPEDTLNYKAINEIDITITAKNTFNVTGTILEGKGAINGLKTEIVDGSIIDVTFIPETGYMIDKVAVNGVEVEVIDNKLNLTINENKNIEVCYKKIPFKIIVKDTNNVVITPNGTISILYGDSKEFSIIAKSGYRLKKVLVNNIDKINDVKNNKLVISNITADTTVEVIVEKISYAMIERDGTVRKNNSARFKVNAEYSLFNSVFVDNVLVNAKNYTVKEGSTIITLKKEYVNTLSVGTHTLKITFSDGGEVITKFSVSEALNGNNNNNNNGNNNSSKDNNNDNNNNDESHNNNDSAKDNTKDNNNDNTKDNNKGNNNNSNDNKNNNNGKNNNSNNNVNNDNNVHDAKENIVTYAIIVLAVTGVIVLIYIVKKYINKNEH